MERRLLPLLLAGAPGPGILVAAAAPTTGGYLVDRVQQKAILAIVDISDKDCLCDVAEDSEFVVYLSVVFVWRSYRRCGGRREAVPRDSTNCTHTPSPPPPPSSPPPKRHSLTAFLIVVVVLLFVVSTAVIATIIVLKKQKTPQAAVVPEGTTATVQAHVAPSHVEEDVAVPLVVDPVLLSTRLPLPPPSPPPFQPPSLPYVPVH
ncbi:hypothetical protein ACP70R_021758 [Stipagrostis hirtigluma subsp. patula]